MNSKILSSTLVVVSLVAAVGGSAFALFRDTEYIPGNTISTGAVDIVLTDDSAQFPSPIKADNLMAGQWTDWSKVNVTNNSNTDISLYFYVTNVEGEACYYTNLELKDETGIAEELSASTFNHGGDSESLFNSSIMTVKGIDNKVKISDPTLAVDGVTTVVMRAGLSEDAGDEVMGRSCSWTGVFLAEPALHEEEPPVSFPTSFPEVIEAL